MTEEEPLSAGDVIQVILLVLALGFVILALCW